VKSDNYVTIHGWMCNELNLKGNDLLVFAYIYSYSRDGQNKCYSSLETIADTFNLSKQTIINSIKKLVDNGYIIKHLCTDNTKSNSYEYNAEVVKNFDYTSQKNLLPPSQNFLLNNNSNISISKDIDINNKIDNKEVEWFLNNYHSTCVSLPRVMKLSDKRRKAIIKILNKFSKDDILDCFDKIEESDFLIGNNDRGWKADIDFILREDKFINILEGKYGGKKKRSTTHDRISESGDLYVEHSNKRKEVAKYGTEKF